MIPQETMEGGVRIWQTDASSVGRKSLTRAGREQNFVRIVVFTYAPVAALADQYARSVERQSLYEEEIRRDRPEIYQCPDGPS